MDSLGSIFVMLLLCIYYAFDDQSDKFGNKECSYLKKGVAYKPRDSECDVPMHQVCQWNRKYQFSVTILWNIFSCPGPSCTDEYTLYPAESDGRTCYSTTQSLLGAAKDTQAKCLTWPNI